MQKQFSLQFKVLTARFGKAKEKLLEDPNYKFRIYFTKRNGKTNTTGESYYTTKTDLRDSLMTYKNEVVQFDNIDRDNDSIEISFAIFNANNKKYKPFVIKVKDLAIAVDKDDLYTIPIQNLLNVVYTLKENPEMIVPIQIPKDVREDMGFGSNAISIAKKKSKDEDSLKGQNSHIINKEEKGNQMPVNDNDSNNVNYDYYSPKTQPRTASLLTKTKSIFRNILSSKSKKAEEVNLTPPTAPNSLTISQNYEIVEYQEASLKSMKETVSFCEGLFISGLKKEATTVIDKSELFQAPCCHRECSLLPSYQSHILSVYQANHNAPFEIPETVTDMCFPLGLKLCYKCKFDKGAQAKVIDAPTPYRPFMNIILNEKGKRYIVTLIYFKKMKVKDFEKEYKLYPIKEFFKLNQDTEQNDRDIQNAFNIMTQFVAQSTILIPETITLISKFPYINQMSQCLKSMIGLSKEQMNSLISYIANDVPVPSLNQSVWFYLPNEPQPIQLGSPANFVQESLAQTKNVFNYLSVKNIIFIFHLMLLEQKILFIDNDYKLLSELSFIFISLLYPLDWVNTYIPVLSLSTVEFLQSFIPFIMGIDEYLLTYSTQKGYIMQNESDGIVYVSISKNLISTSLPKKREGKKTLLKDLNIPDFPEKVHKKLYKELKEIKAKAKKGENVEKMLKDAFVKAIIMIICNYKAFTYYPKDSVPLVNKELYCAFPSSKDQRAFRAEILASQNYNQFILNEKESIGKRKASQMQLANDVIYSAYFNKMYSVHCKPFKVKKPKDSQSKANKAKNPKGKHVHLTTILEETSSDYSSDTKNTSPQEKEPKESEMKTYLLSPYFIKNPLLSNERSKIEEWIISNTANSQGEQCIKLQDCFILEYISAESSFQCIKDSAMSYKYAFTEDHPKEVNQFVLEEGNEHNATILGANQHHLSEEDQNSLFECFKSICLINKKLPNDYLPTMIPLLKKLSGVNHLISLLLPENRYLKKLEKKIIKEECFNDLVLLIKTALSSLREMDYTQGRQLTLIALSYYKVVTTKEGKGPYYVYEGFSESKFRSSMWIDDHFWMSFIKEEHSATLSAPLNTNEELISESYIMAVYSLMHSLPLSKTLIKKSLLFPTASKYFNTETRIILERRINED